MGTRNTFDLFQHAKSNNLPGLMLQIDFSKAFDSISFEFIENTLKLFNLNSKYISWINTLLRNFQSSIMINGFPTTRIRVGRGCRQGDPIAGYLFIIWVELLLLKLQSCRHIQPWHTITNQLKLLEAYADDINLFLTYNHPTQQPTLLLLHNSHTKRPAPTQKPPTHHSHKHHQTIQLQSSLKQHTHTQTYTNTQITHMQT